MKAIVLAGGIGSRMKRLNNIPKVFQPIKGVPIIELEIKKLIQLGIQEKDIIVVLSPETLDYAKENLTYKNVIIAIQPEPNGSGGAVKACLQYIDDTDWVIIMNGDSPIFYLDTMRDIIKRGLPTLSTTVLDDPYGYGRVFLNNDGLIERIVEEKECNEEQAKINLVNTSIFYVKGDRLKDAVGKLNNDNVANEYFIVKIVETYNLYPFNLTHPSEGFNINTPEQLTEATLLMNPAPEPPVRHLVAKRNGKCPVFVGDIHGCYDTFMKLLNHINFSPEKHLLISVGDITQKGKSSGKVIDWFINNPSLCVRGNAEEEIISGIVEPNFDCNSRRMGFLKSLPYTIKIDDLDILTVHAGLKYGKDLKDQKPYDMTMMRNISVDKSGRLHGSHRHDIGNPWYVYWKSPTTIVYGHDAIRGIVKRDNTLCLDSGCVYGGSLTCAIFDGDKYTLHSVNNCD